MAIKLTKVLDNGFEASYWRVINVQADADSKIVNGMVVVYKDKESRDSLGVPAEPPSLFSFEAYNVSCDLFELSYEYLKQSQLIGGEDV